MTGYSISPAAMKKLLMDVDGYGQCWDCVARALFTAT